MHKTIAHIQNHLNCRITTKKVIRASEARERNTSYNFHLSLKKPQIDVLAKAQHHNRDTSEANSIVVNEHNRFQEHEDV